MNDRLNVALHLPQELLPLTGTGGPKSGGGRFPSPSPRPNPTPTPTPTAGVPRGYGPPMPHDGTPLTRLVAATLYTNTSPNNNNNSHNNSSNDAEAEIRTAGSRTEYDLVALPLTNRNWQARWERMCVRMTTQSQFDLGHTQALDPDQPTALEAETWRGGGAFRRNEVNVTRSEESGSLIAFASDWLELDSPDEGLRFDSELALRQEITYASYLSLTTIIVAPPRAESSEYLADYARAINGALSSSWHINISIRIPLSLQPTPHPGSRSPTQATFTQDDGETWRWWNTIRAMCSYSSRLSLTLDMTNVVPAAQYLGRWAAEPVKFIFLPSTTFIPNAKAYPVLTKNVQAFLKRCFRHDPTVILSGTERGLHMMGGPLAYVQYVRHLHRKAAPLDPVEQYAQGYMDHLQQPLQPLMDNLEGETYEGFEKDPIKYRQYEEAVYQALLDRPEHNPVTIFVVGAGRGPLVAGCLRASERSRRKVLLTAVEKNPSAFVILQERGALEWGSGVKLVLSDMRSFNPVEKADIIVSELLGSFGDNELSPECLDGVMRCLKPDGISIPSSYTSFLAPITTAKLHAEVTRPGPGTSSVVGSSGSPAEQPYVVMFSAFHILSAATGREGFDKVQECWSFVHPSPRITFGEDGLPLTNSHNTRSAHLSFHIAQAGVCHGFAGYFEATLYKNVGLSIHPERAAGDMLSWFPIFFPLSEPMYLPAQSELDVQMWRMTDGAKRKVWFEWSCSAYLSITTPIIPTHLITPLPANGNEAQSPWMALASPMLDEAFQSASSPLLGQNLHTTHPNSNAGGAGGDRRDSGRMPGIEENGVFDGNNRRSTTSSGGGGVGGGGSQPQTQRIMISMSRLHNPGGRTNYIGV